MGDKKADIFINQLGALMEHPEWSGFYTYNNDAIKDMYYDSLTKGGNFVKDATCNNREQQWRMVLTQSGAQDRFKHTGLSKYLTFLVTWKVAGGKGFELVNSLNNGLKHPC